MSNINLSRTQRRAIERKARRMNKARVVAGTSMVALMAGGIISPAMAANSNTAEVVLTDYFDSETGNQQTAWEIKDNGAKKLEMTKAERENILRLASGKMQGQVSLSMSDADKKKLADAGINFDIAASEKRTNARIAEINDLNNQNPGYAFVTQPELLVKYSIDKAKATTAAKTLGLTDLNEDNPFQFGTVHGSGRMVMDNIMSDKVRGDVSGYKQGEQLANIGTVNGLFDKAYDNSGKAINGYEIASRLYPVSQTVNGGVAEKDGVSNATTTLTDPYADGDSTARQTAINSVSARGFTGDISNCLTDDCGLYFAVEVGTENGAYMLTDTVRLNVKSTVSAGKAPTTLTLKSGDKVTFVPEKSGVVGVEKVNREFESNYFTASKVGEWQFASQFADNIKNLKNFITADNESNLSGSPRGDAGIYLGIDTTNSAVTTKVVKVDSNTVRVTLSAGKKTGFKVKNKAITESNIGKGINLTDDHKLTLEKLSDKEAVFLLENTWSDMTPAEVQVESLMLGIEQTLFLPGASLDATGGYSLTYVKAPEKPVEPPKPTPEQTPKPDPKPLPKPEAIKDTKSGKQGEPVSVKVMDNDTVSKGFKYKAKSLRLVSPETKKEVTTYSFDKQGTYAVQGENVVFTPEPEFKGVAPVIGYSWVESNGDVEQGADSTVQVTITGETKPVVTPDPEPKPTDDPIIPDDDKEKPKPKPSDDPIKPVSDPEPKPTDDPIIPDDDKEKPKPTGDPIEEEKVIEDKVTDSDGGKSEPEKVEEGVNNSGADVVATTVFGGGILAAIAGMFMFRSRKVKINPARKH